MPRTKRVIFRVARYHASTWPRLMWKLRWPWPGRSELFETKYRAVQAGRMEAWLNKPSQLVVHGKDGRIQFDHTYGADPRRTKG